jgi:hypothetical protein
MKNVMIDIETMGTHTSNSLILSVGAWGFDLKKAGPTFKEVPFLRVLALEPQMLKGRQIDRPTQDWWAQQSLEARSHWESASEKIHPMCLRSAIADYLSDLSSPDTLILANGVVFDIGNLENLFSLWGASAPWKYNVARDARTIYQLTKKRAMPDDPTFVGHDPIGDCNKQIWRLWEHAPEEMLFE